VTSTIQERETTAQQAAEIQMVSRDFHRCPAHGVPPLRIYFSLVSAT